MRLFLFSFAAAALLLSDNVATPQTKGFQLTADEKLILDLTNAARKENNVGALAANQLLTQCARLHSENQAKQQKMAHELDGKTAADRVKAIGYLYSNMGENVAYGDNPVPVRKIFEGWMNSEGHRKNILKTEFTEIGIGVGSKDGKKYYTQVFGRPRR